MWTSPAHRGTGLARELLDTIFAWAAGNAFSRIEARVSAGNERALRFYVNRGFILEEAAGAESLLVKAVRP